MKPPANIANAWFGSEVAARRSRATLRVAVFHRPVFALNMFTTLLYSSVSAERCQKPAAEAYRTPPSDEITYCNHPLPTLAKDATQCVINQNIKLQTFFIAAREHRQSFVRKRGRGKITSRTAESGCRPSPRARKQLRSSKVDEITQA